MLAIVAAATLPVRGLLAPEFSAQSVRRFADGAELTMEGRIVRAPTNEQGGRTYLYVSAARAGLAASRMAPAHGLVRITALGTHFRIGDEIRVTGRIRFPRNDGDPGEFDYRAWLMRQGIAATIFAASSEPAATPSIVILGHREVFPGSEIEAVRDRIGEFIDATLGYPENAEMRALIIGDRGGIDERLREPFALTGMAHLLVISGLHLGFVAAAAFLSARVIMGFFPTLMALGYANKAGAIFAALAVSAYASIAGGHVSTIRALVMVLAYALAVLIDRSRELLASLALAALVICFAIPGSTADIGFQLSFASVLVILLGMRRFTAWWRWRYANPLAAEIQRSRLNRVAEWGCGYLAVSFWAMLGTAPLTAFHFNQFSLIGVVANAVVVPIMGLGAVVAGLIAALASFVYLPVARDLLVAAGKLAEAGTYLARWFAGWPLAWARTFTPTALELAIAYGFLLLWLTAPLAGDEFLQLIRVGRRRPAYDFVPTATRWRATGATILIAVLALDAGWWTYQRFFNPALRVTFLSVGEGDAAVVRFPGSRVMLIDGGGAFRGTFDPGERLVAPYLWSNKIMHVDYIALSHPDRDHFGGLTFIVRNFAPSQFWTGGASSDDESYSDLIEAVRTAGVRQRICDSANPPMTIGGVNVRCLGPLRDTPEIKHNNSSMVLRIAQGRSVFLFTGDLEAKGERELIHSGATLRAAILKVPHHGSATSSSPEFIEAVHPAVAIFSLGYLNQFHFPAAQVLARYRENGVKLFRTDDDGAVSVEAGRDTIRLETFRGDTLVLPAR